MAPKLKEPVEEIQRTSVFMRRSTWRAMKVRAAQEGRPLVDVITEALESYLRRKKKGGKDGR